MYLKTQKISLKGPAGLLETQLDGPDAARYPQPKGVAIVAHPHPLKGGTMDNKVVHTLSRAFVQSGWQTVRFNFRGVGASEGVYDEGRGELADLLAVLEQCAPTGPIALAGFSFGAFVTSHAVAAVAPTRALEHIVLVGTAAGGFDVAPIAAALHERTLVLHGDEDDTVPLANVMEWARPQVLPVTVVPGIGHFFHGQLPLLRSIVMRHLHTCP
jgi:uncharacterized protein